MLLNCNCTKPANFEHGKTCSGGLLFCGYSVCIYYLLAYIVCFPSYPFFFTFPYLSFPLRIDPFRFQAKSHKRRPNLGFFSSYGRPA